MKRARKQRVVLRSKVRRLHWKGFALKFLISVAALSLLGALSFGALFAREFLNKSEYFLVKSLTVSPPEGEASRKILKAIASWKGKPIWKLDLRKFAQRTLNDTPEFKKFKIRRVWPDGIEVRFELRSPIARVSVGEAQIFRYVDEKGVLFRQRLGGELPQNLPALEIPSREMLPQAVAFLNRWVESSPLKLRKLEMNEWRELKGELAGNTISQTGTAVAWGLYESENFEIKMARLEAILSDLEKKSLHAAVVSLKEAFVPNEIKEERGQISGRAFVQLAKSSS